MYNISVIIILTAEDEHVDIIGHEQENDAFEIIYYYINI